MHTIYIHTYIKVISGTHTNNIFNEEINSILDY